MLTRYQLAVRKIAKYIPKTHYAADTLDVLYELADKLEKALPVYRKNEVICPTCRQHIDVTSLNKELIEKAKPKPYNTSSLGYECPACGNYIENDVDTDYYCSQCGQAIDWSKQE